MDETKERARLNKKLKKKRKSKKSDKRPEDNVVSLYSKGSFVIANLSKLNNDDQSFNKSLLEDFLEPGNFIDCYQGISAVNLSELEIVLCIDPQMSTKTESWLGSTTCYIMKCESCIFSIGNKRTLVRSEDLVKIPHGKPSIDLMNYKGGLNQLIGLFEY